MVFLTKGFAARLRADASTMRSSKSASRPETLDLRAGDVAEVRSAEEILATLDEKGRLELLPFMPEMLRFCGKRFTVRKSAHKACDRVEKTGLRRMRNAVHLGDLRCDGASHDGCQAACLLFWKEAWLRKVKPGAPDEPADGPEPLHGASQPSSDATPCGGRPAGAPATIGTLLDATRTEPGPASPDETRYFCQATEMFRATSPIPWWDFSHYLRDVRTRNARAGHVLRWLVTRTLNRIRGSRVRGAYRLVELIGGNLRVPEVGGTLRKTPSATLDLQPGELVRVKDHEAIRGTLDVRARTRGLSFDVEMVRYCGGNYRVLGRVERIIDEPTGRMVTLPNECIILDGVVCTADYHGLCPRAIYPFWREIWLERVGGETQAPPAGRAGPPKAEPLPVERHGGSARAAAGEPPSDRDPARQEALWDAIGCLDRRASNAADRPDPRGPDDAGGTGRERRS